MKKFTSLELRSKLDNINERLESRALPFVEIMWLSSVKREIVAELYRRDRWLEAAL